MRSENLLLRIVVLAALGLGFWALARYGTAMPMALPETAPANAFSVGRAESVLARILGPEIPHPVSTEENERVRERILREYGALGIATSTYKGFGCRLNKRSPFLACATVTDVIANVRPGAGRAIVMLSHLDSVPAGPGAADDEADTAAIIESARAIGAANDPSLHPILAVNTDGEEADLLGAAAFLDNPVLKGHVGAVVNVEARGNQGPSLLFQMSPGDGPLLDVYAKTAPTYATSSLTEVIYKMLPNDTDLTIFIEDGFPSWNFAFNGNVAHYHTSLDRRANLDPASVQMQGESLLGVVRGLEVTKYKDLRGADAIYVSILGRWLPRLPASWAMPLSLLVLIVLVLALVLSRRADQGGGWWAAFLIVPVAVIAGAVAGMILHEVAVLVSGQPDPSYAYPSMLRAALAFGVLAVTVMVARLADIRAATFGVWLWMAGLSLLTSVLLTGLSPYFLFPLLVAAPVLLVASLLKLDLRSVAGQIVLAAAAVPQLLIWLSLVHLGESIQGLYLNEVFTVPAVFGLVTLVPILVAKDAPRGAWAAATGVLTVVALGLAVVAGFEPAFSKIAPQRLSIDYVEDAAEHRAYFAAETGWPAVAPLPASVRRAANFGARPERLVVFGSAAYVAPAGPSHFAPPTAHVEVTAAGTVRRVTIALHASPKTNQLFLAIPKDAQLKTIMLDEKRFEVPAAWSRSASPYDAIACFSSDCADKTVVLELASKAKVKIVLGEVRFGLPPEAQKLVAARPDTAVQSQNGDTTILLNTVEVRAR